MLLKVAVNYSGILLNTDLELEILTELRWLYDDPKSDRFANGPHLIFLGPYKKEYIVRLKDNVILSCERITMS